ncbi:MAG: ribonuclease P protein component [Ruthenibacterium sp.]
MYRVGSSFGSHLMVLMVRKKKGAFRVGFVCGKKVGNAVVRNHARRLFKENFRLLCHNVTDGVDLIFIGRAPIAAATFHDVEKTMQKLLLKAGVLRYND